MTAKERVRRSQAARRSVRWAARTGLWLYSVTGRHPGALPVGSMVHSRTAAPGGRRKRSPDVPPQACSRDSSSGRGGRAPERRHGPAGSALTRCAGCRGPSRSVRRGEAAPSQDLRSPDARDAARDLSDQVAPPPSSIAASSRADYQDLRSPDARDAARRLPPVELRPRPGVTCLSADSTGVTPGSARPPCSPCSASRPGQR